MIAIVPVRAGQLPAGAEDCVAETGGRALVVGTGVDEAVVALATVARDVLAAETPAPLAQLVAALAAALVDEPVIVLPTSPDGRDLAPALAHELRRPLLAGALSVQADGATCTRWGGRVVEDLHVDGPFVATLQPASGIVAHPAVAAEPRVTTLVLAADDRHSPDVLAVLPPDVASMDLAEAGRIVGGGAGLDRAEQFDLLQEVATALGAAMGGTRVITDRGWIAHERQIGTTGVVVRPQLYLALGISGAVQHTSGLGDPAHIVSVNTDPHCPMMQLADLALVTDANATLAALAGALGLTDVNGAQA